MLLVVATPCLADDGWDRGAHALSLFGCTALLLGAAGAVWRRTGAIVLAILVGGPATVFTVLIFNDNVMSLWVAYLICYFVFLFCCVIGVLRSVGGPHTSLPNQPMPPNKSLERMRER
jgi:peptidoglycan/LPS O-acetylase OafA/YrhL